MHPSVVYFSLPKQYQVMMWLPSSNSLSHVVKPGMCRKVIYVNICIISALQHQVQ